MNEVKFDGEKLFEIRRNKKISQGKLAEKIGVSRQTIYSWESNQNAPDLEKINKICKVLEIDISELVDFNILNNENNNIENRNEKKRFFKYFVIVFIIFVIIYIFIVTIKFIRLRDILDKWNKLNKENNYYIKVEEYCFNNNDLILENYFMEKYNNNSNFITLIKDSKNKETEIIVLCDYKNKIKYIINEKEKTIAKEQIDWRDESVKLMNNYQNIIRVSDNILEQYLFCLNPNFIIKLNKNKYEIKYENINEYINKENGIIECIVSENDKAKSVKTYYQVELNTDKDVKIDLSQYVEVNK